MCVCIVFQTPSGVGGVARGKARVAAGGHVSASVQNPRSMNRLARLCRHEEGPHMAVCTGTGCLVLPFRGMLFACAIPGLVSPYTPEDKASLVNSRVSAV